VRHFIETIPGEEEMPFIKAAIFDIGRLCYVRVSRPGTGRRPSDAHRPPVQAKVDGKAIRTEVALALVNATAMDSCCRLVTGLERENFRVFRDGIEQQIISFSSEEVPVSIGLIFDMSGSTSDKVDRARETR
jgi:Ca-activated chloride channel homolog